LAFQKSERAAVATLRAVRRSSREPPVIDDEVLLLLLLELELDATLDEAA